MKDVTQDALELATTEQLIEELFNRHTFQGILIHSEHRNQWTEGKRIFKFSYSGKNLNKEEAICIIESIIERLKFKS